MPRSVSILVSCAFVLSGCATSSQNLSAIYVSPVQYQGYDCEQLGAESRRIQTHVTQLGGRLDEAASNDKMFAGAGLLIFWPALFFIGGTKQQEAEYSRLKGEYDAVQQASISKKCPAALNATPPATPAAGASTPAPNASAAQST